jgi:AraC-like DNA-binding protein
MQLGHDYTRFDTLHLNSELIAVCSFHLHRDAPEFSAWKALLRHHIVLPRAAMRLHQERREVFVADPVMATLHDPGVAFRREPVAGQDDDSDYFILSEALIDELAASADVPTGRRRAGYRFGRSQAPLPDSLFRNAHRVFAQLRKSWASSPSLLWLEERAIALAAEIVCATERSSLPQPAIRSCPARGDAVTRAKCYLAEHLDRMPSLSEIASAAHSSPFHLTRLFRVRTGLSLHRYLMTLKARAAYLRLPLFRGRLARLATETGYTDLPHMSRQFERAFGAGPRALLRAEDAAT